MARRDVHQKQVAQSSAILLHETQQKVRRRCAALLRRYRDAPGRTGTFPERCALCYRFVNCIHGGV